MVYNIIKLSKEGGSKMLNRLDLRAALKTANIEISKGEELKLAS